MTVWTPEKLLALGKPAPQLAAAIESCPTLQNQPKVFDLDVLAHIRANINIDRAPLDPTILETDIDCPGRDGITIKLRWYRPAAPLVQESPLVVHYHGGGYILGNLNSATAFCRTLVRDHGAVVIDVDYRLAPEHPFPAGKDDAWDALLWVSKNYKDLGASPTLEFIVAGCSAGGNIAASMALVARDENLNPPLTGTYLNVPELVSPELKLPDKYAPLWLSRNQNKAAPILDQPFIDFLMECYKPDFKSHYFAPAHHPQGHAGLPKTYIDVCGLGPFRDDGIIYEQLLQEADVLTKLTIFPGLPHGWWMVLPELEDSKEWHEKTRQGLQWLFAK
ncbi:Alpha/beta hydrolase fold-3 [Akanthomyces lecanii RCEF 1005]|uniref:Alpha/beta hydrolase fold-3 n=1 Tax=Akanthomyces lecanii RCEF 1005 TaxID=1081108 RepID=A0A168HLE0_CORDF|nr:Alpha/beta hydrolase fold-3 [Akanthomyces lecanii RCEF 1005]